MKLEHLMGTRSRISILRHLCRESARDFSVSELADATNLNKSLISRNLADLERQKIVITWNRGNLKLCQINSKKGTYNMLVKVFASERNLLKGG